MLEVLRIHFLNIDLIQNSKTLFHILYLVLNQLFEANTNPTDVKDIEFPVPVFARLLRVVPKKFHDKPAMRMEVFGYNTSKCNWIGQYIMSNHTREPHNSTFIHKASLTKRTS